MEAKNTVRHLTFPLFICGGQKGDQSQCNVMKPLVALSIALCALLLIGCASTIQYPPFADQTKTIEDPEKARIYVMRPAQAWNAHSIIRLSAAGRTIPSYSSIHSESGVAPPTTCALNWLLATFITCAQARGWTESIPSRVSKF
jgi:hypothetical protein